MEKRKAEIIRSISTIITYLGIIATVVGVILIFVGTIPIAALCTFVGGIVVTAVSLFISSRMTDLIIVKGNKNALKSLRQTRKKYIKARKAEEKIEAEKRQEEIKQAQHPQCPACHGYNTQRITTASRVIGTAMVGLASSTIGKQYECLDCKHKW